MNLALKDEKQVYPGDVLKMWKIYIGESTIRVSVPRECAEDEEDLYWGIHHQGKYTPGMC